MRIFLSLGQKLFGTKCEICGKRYKNKMAVNVHISKTHLKRISWGGQ